MADPAWGMASSLSDEETARALCAFHHTEPLPTQRRRPLQRQQQQQPVASLYQTHNGNREVPHFARSTTSHSTFGYPTNGHTMPVSIRRNEAASVLVGMHTPSTSSDDWQRQQQRVIQQQLEQQQRELQVQIQQEQQRDMQVQVLRIQAQVQQQQEEVHRQQHRKLGRIKQQPRYSAGAGVIVEQTKWRNEVQTSPVASRAVPNFGGGNNRNRGVGMQQFGQLYDGGFGRSQQLPVRPTTAAPSYMSEYAGRAQAGAPVHRSEDMFAPQQVQQPAQSCLQARNSEKIVSSALHPWGGNDSRSFTGIQTDRANAFQMQTTQQRFMPQQPQQPQPFYPIERSERNRQETVTLRNGSRPSSDEVFLNDVMRHFPASTASPASMPTTVVGAVAGINFASCNYKATLNSVPARNLTDMRIQGIIDAHSRPPVLPTGAAVVPGVSLVPPAVRCLTMQDILNSGIGPSGVELSKNRSRGGKQKRAPTKHKMPRKQTPTKRQRVPLQHNESSFQPPPVNRGAGASPSRQGTSLAPNGDFTLVNKPCTPMYKAFMESRAARALEQTVASTKPSGMLVPKPQSQVEVQSTGQPGDRAMELVPGRPIPAKRTTVKALSNISNPLMTNQCDQQSTTQDSTSGSAKQVPEYSQVNASIGIQSAGERHDLADVPVSDSPMDERFEQHLRQQQFPQVAVVTKVVKSIKSSAKMDVVQIGKGGTSSKKRPRTKLTSAGSNFPSGGALQQQVKTLFPNGGLHSATESTEATAVTPTSNPLPPENRTVVIFCKRDFMRYQAAKIWRKYQEQLTKHEEWREVRVAGKRTRYLNSRYDDQKTCKRTYTRSGKPRRKTSQTTKGARCRTVSLSTTDPAHERSTANLYVFGGKSGDDGNTSAKEPGLAVNADSTSSRIGDSSMTLQDATEPLQEQLPRTQDADKSAVVAMMSCGPSNEVVGALISSEAHSGLKNTSPDSNVGTTVAYTESKRDVAADTLPCGNVESTIAVSESTPSVLNAAPDGITCSSARAPSNGSAEVSVAAPDSTVTTTVDDGAPNGSTGLSIADAAADRSIEATTGSDSIIVDPGAASGGSTAAVADGFIEAIDSTLDSPHGTVDKETPSIVTTIAVVSNSNIDTVVKAGEVAEEDWGKEETPPFGGSSSSSTNNDTLVQEGAAVAAEDKQTNSATTLASELTCVDPVVANSNSAVSTETKQVSPDSAALQGENSSDKAVRADAVAIYMGGVTSAEPEHSEPMDTGSPLTNTDDAASVTTALHEGSSLCTDVTGMQQYK